MLVPAGLEHPLALLFPDPPALQAVGRHPIVGVEAARRCTRRLGCWDIDGLELVDDRGAGRQRDDRGRR
jgi:hypothetical protein